MSSSYWQQASVAVATLGGATGSAGVAMGHGILKPFPCPMTESEKILAIFTNAPVRECVAILGMTTDGFLVDPYAQATLMGVIVFVACYFGVELVKHVVIKYQI